jgi:hypothetical protein
MSMVRLPEGEGIYLDQNGIPYWIKRPDIGEYLIEDQNGNEKVISASHPGLSDPLLRVLAKLDRLSK